MATNRQQGRENRKRVFDYVVAHKSATRSEVACALGIDTKSADSHLLYLYEKHFLNRYTTNKREGFVFKVGGLWRANPNKAHEDEDFYASS